MQLLIIFSDSLLKWFHFLCILRTRSTKTGCSRRLFVLLKIKNNMLHSSGQIKACITLPIILKLCLCGVWKPSMPPSEWETALDLKLAWIIWEMWQNVTFNIKIMLQLYIYIYIYIYHLATSITDNIHKLLTNN